jgi:HEAT repeat protein/cyclophilin family peptidyl-prolyl cis-trans isomerase
VPCATSDGRRAGLGAIAGVLAAFIVLSAQTGKPPLDSNDLDDIARLLMLEDTRRFDAEALSRIIKSPHPEVRRRAVLAVGRIADPAGAALLDAARADKDVDVVATAMFSAGQLKVPGTIPWLEAAMASADSPTAVAREAAIALGKFQGPEARAALARYLGTAAQRPQSAPVVGEALLSIGRFNVREDLTPIVRWANSPDPEVRWRAAWALFRPRDPAAAPHLFRLTNDQSAAVRFWAIRGLTPPTAPPTAGGAAPPAGVTAEVDPTGFDRAKFSERLRRAVKDPDRRVRTEALRALAQFDDDESFAVVIQALESPDSWLSVSAAEVMGRFTRRADTVVPRLVAASAKGRPLSLRISALTPLVALSPPAAVDLAAALAREESVVARTAARQALGRLEAAGRAKLDALTAEGVFPPPPPRGEGRGRGRGNTEPREPRPAAEYRALVERFIVPDYNRAPRPRAIWDTPRGTLELELYPGDAPFGVEYFLKVVESGEIAGTEFGRVVPNFVAQQRPIRDQETLRDEVNRHGLTRGNLSWASAGLDTGRPGYTLANTPQPHNEGNFTALGRVVSGMDVVDRLELGDKITAARIRR